MVGVCAVSTELRSGKAALLSVSSHTASSGPGELIGGFLSQQDGAENKLKS